MGKSLVSCFLRHSVHYVYYVGPYASLKNANEELQAVIFEYL